MSEIVNHQLVTVPEALQEPLRKLRHELRTPLNHIIGLSDLWADQTGDDSVQQELSTDLIRIRDAAWKLNDMLDLLMVEEGFCIPVDAPKEK